jgi:hypothetical protein
MDEQARKELDAVDDLLVRLLPEDDLVRLVDKDATAAATMVGYVTLARDLLKRAVKRLEEPDIAVVKRPRKITIPESASPNGRARKHEYHARVNGRGGRVGDWVLEQLKTGPKLRNELAIGAMTAGVCTASTTAYGSFKKLQQLGKITFDEESNRVELVE